MFEVGILGIDCLFQRLVTNHQTNSIEGPHCDHILQRFDMVTWTPSPVIFPPPTSLGLKAGPQRTLAKHMAQSIARELPSCLLDRPWKEVLEHSQGLCR